MESRKPPKIDPRVYLLLSITTIGLGVVSLILYLRTPSTAPQEAEKMLFLIFASALLPAGILWTMEHYFLQEPMEEGYQSVLEMYRDEQKRLIERYGMDQRSLLEQQRAKQRLAETMQCVEEHHFRAISDERELLVKNVLDPALGVETCHEIIIVGSTLNGLFRQGVWFEEFIRNALSRGKQLELMLTHWDYVTHREKQEDRADGAIADELRQSLARLLAWGVPKKSIRLVRGAPTVFMVIAGNNMVLNPYPFGRESVTSLAIWLANPDPSRPDGPPGSIWHEYYVNHYDIVWNPQKYPRRLCTIKDPISTELPDDWQNQLGRFIEGVRGEAERRSATLASSGSG
ncbi:MAG: hypothetical protein FJ011_05520 [Chloroflexi bacterium]|nr:hypothetical protein [Chloroflexota bacterium]